MDTTTGRIDKLPPEQEAIRAKCFHPTGEFVEFKKEETEQSIPDRFEKVVRKYPDRIAVKTLGQTLTYDALNKAANRVARAILARQERGEEPIALLFEPDAMMLVGILGVLKAGKAWVPLIPSYPRTRATYILEDTQVTLILTNNKNFSLANEWTQDQCPLIILDDIDTSVSDENLELSISPDALSCILYTSGSSGQPKGGVHNHRNLIHLIMRNTNSLHICSEDRLSLLSTYSHIAGVKDILRALLNGAAVFPFDLKEKGLVNLADWLTEEEITIYHSVPSVFRYFLDALNEEKEFPKVRQIHLGGEPVSKRDVELYRKRFSATCILLNKLGATEISGYQQYVIDKNTQITDNIVPAGYSVQDTEVLLLNEAGDMVGFNEIGEIAVKSRYVALGYWRNPELTREKFLPVPDGDDERMYLTGDLGQILPGGCLFHLGRKDSLIKVRGYRISITEVEMALLELPQVKEASVVAWDSETGEKYLAAYIVSRSESSPTVSELRGLLRIKLPDYMLPSAFVFLDSLPQTNGKVNRLALPRPERVRPNLDQPYAAATYETEQQLVQVWEDILDFRPIGIHDNFFDLGGHSLAATRIVSQVIKKFQVEVPLQSLFQAPTVAEMAAVITEHQAKKLDEKDLDRILTELEALSEEDAQRVLSTIMQNEAS